jgi:FkbM family methyltransferase
LEQRKVLLQSKRMAVHPLTILPDDFKTRLVIFGAGGLGRRIARGLRGVGVVAQAFCDNNRALWGTEIEGIQTVSPAAALERFPDAIFIVAIWHPSPTEGIRRRVVDLQSLGCRNVVSFIPLLWMYPEIFLPNLFWETPAYFNNQMTLINTARELLDDSGKEEFDRQLAFRLSGDLQCLGEPAPGLQYFPDGLIALSNTETFVDCGAFNGDTIRDFIIASGGCFRRVIALEPDLRNCQELMTSVADTRIRIEPYAVGAKREVLRMSSSGASSAVCDEGDTEVLCVPLDELLGDEIPTYIKMDIEGSELKALRGAAETIRRCSPKLAVCVYHHPDHLWQVPLLLKELLPDSTLTLRSHMLDGFDTVCYCIPNR